MLQQPLVCPVLKSDGPEFARNLDVVTQKLRQLHESQHGGVKVKRVGENLEEVSLKSGSTVFATVNMQPKSDTNRFSICENCCCKTNPLRSSRKHSETREGKYPYPPPQTPLLGAGFTNPKYLFLQKGTFHTISSDHYKSSNYATTSPTPTLPPAEANVYIMTVLPAAAQNAEGGSPPQSGSPEQRLSEKSPRNGCPVSEDISVHTECYPVCFNVM